MKNVEGINIFTDQSDGPRGFEVCECCKCGYVGKCTPTFDFYVTDESSGKLICESCFRIYVSKIVKK